MVFAELIGLLLVSVAGGLVIASWAAGRDEHLDAWSDIDIAYSVIVTAVGVGFALRLLWLPFPFGSVVAAVRGGLQT